MEIVSYSPNYELVEVRLKWGFYELKANILNLIGESTFHSNPSSDGNNSKVYHVREDFKDFSVKCCQTYASSAQTKRILILKAFREYFVFRIASALEIGPRREESIGFDVVFSEDCV